jgi:hypothetical protein
MLLNILNNGKSELYRNAKKQDKMNCNNAREGR